MAIAPYIRALTRLGPKYVVITDGARGAYVGSAEAILFAPALPSKVASTAGAGDAFAATFVAFVAVGRPLDESLRAATVNSAAVVRYIDTQSGLLRRQELDQQLAALGQSAIRKWAM